MEYSLAGDPLYGDPVGDCSLAGDALAGLATFLATGPCLAASAL